MTLQKRILEFRGQYTCSRVPGVGFVGSSKGRAPTYGSKQQTPSPTLFINRR